MSAAGPRFLRLLGASFGHGGRTLVGPLDLELRPGQALGLCGSNGCGKSTLLRGVLGLLEPLTGRVERTGRVAAVFQRQRLDPLFPSTTEELVSQGTRRPGDHPLAHDVRRAVSALLEALGLAEQRRQPFAELSGGQLQRALLARALVGEPDLLVLDEPFEGLDPAGAASVEAELARRRRDRGLALLLVEHDRGHLFRVSERVLELRAGQLVPLDVAAGAP
jgi:ABC-type Mn2+/Zn2+ transport system ATPase subunit